MTRLYGLILAATTVFVVPALAAPQSERIRGTIESVDPNGVTVQTLHGDQVKLVLTDATKYVAVAKSSLSNVEKGNFIGTSTRDSSAGLVALEVHIFPPSMRGTGEGHYGWDNLPDTTMAGGGNVATSMTNGTVQAVSPNGPRPDVRTTMTNGNVGSVSRQGRVERIVVTYNGGEQTILVPPTASIVAYQPAEYSAVTSGAHVVIRASDEGGKMTAEQVAVGKDGLVPPM